MSSTTLPPPATAPPRLMAPVTPLVRRLYYQLRDLPFADQQLVFLRLDSLTGGSSGQEDDPRVPWCLEAMAACRAKLDVARISKGRYEAWQAALPDPSVWPTSNIIRNAFGSWAAAMARHGAEPLPDVAAKRALAQGAACTRAGLTETLLAWKRDLPADAQGDQLAFGAYRAWAEAKREDPDCTLAELPLSSIGFSRRFGSWAHALCAVGLWAARLRGGQVRRSSGGSASKQLIISSLQRAAREHPRGRLTQRGFDRWVYKQVLAAAEAGEVLTLPSATTAIRRFDTWTAALTAAGLVSPELAGRSRPSAGYRDQDLFDALSACALTLRSGEQVPRRSHYARWRIDQLGGTPKQRIPTDVKLATRFGLWPEVGQAWLEHCRARGSFAPSADWNPRPAEDN